MDNINGGFCLKPNFNIIGHRGAGVLRPENTISSFRYAGELGLNWIEFDTRLTKDHHWLIMHDEDLDRTTTGTGKVSNLTLQEINKFNTVDIQNTDNNHETIPTLEETLKLLNSIKMQANIEIKGAEEDPIFNAKHFNATLAKLLPEDSPLPLVSSFSLEFLKILRSLNPTIPIGYLVEQYTDSTIKIANEFDFNTIHCNVNNFCKNNLIDSKKNNIPVLLYTVNDTNTAEYWLTEGVSSVFTDYPDKLKNLDSKNYLSCK